MQGRRNVVLLVCALGMCQGMRSLKHRSQDLQAAVGPCPFSGSKSHVVQWLGEGFKGFSLMRAATPWQTESSKCFAV